VFRPAGLREFVADVWRRLFLVQLLSSYTHVASGSMLVATRRGLRRRRFSELDPVRLAELLEVVGDAERPGVYRRLGDLALFLTGVFPDHSARLFAPVQRARLLRAAGIRPGAAPGAAPTPSGPGGRTMPGDPPGGSGSDASGSLPSAVADMGEVLLLEELGRRWYRAADRLVPVRAGWDMAVVADLADRFGDARRVLNVVTDRYLFPFRQAWFGVGGG
jgi:hypothetical protein